jgi:hypothetical protein
VKFTFLGKKTSGLARRKEKVLERHVTSTSYEGDGRPALAFRDEHKIE